MRTELFLHQKQVGLMSLIMFLKWRICNSRMVLVEQELKSTLMIWILILRLTMPNCLVIFQATFLVQHPLICKHQSQIGLSRKRVQLQTLCKPYLMQIISQMVVLVKTTFSQEVVMILLNWELDLEMLETSQTVEWGMTFSFLMVIRRTGLQPHLHQAPMILTVMGIQAILEKTICQLRVTPNTRVRGAPSSLEL